MTSTRNFFRIAAISAIIASVGDFLLLYVANSQRSELQLTPLSDEWLWVGGIAGTLAIPLYGLGYHGVARWLKNLSPSAAKLVMISGYLGGLLGGAIHAITAIYIGENLQQAALNADPITAVLQSGLLLVFLWAVTAALVIIISVLITRYIVSAQATVPRSLIVTIPAWGTLVLGVLGLVSPLLYSFLTPAAPNVAHAIFFIACSRPLANNQKVS